MTAKVIYTRRYPPLVNGAEGVAKVAAAATAVLGAERVDAEAPTVGGSEDFAFMLQERPGAYVMIGNGDGPGRAFVHTPKFDFNDALIPIGVAYWLSLVAEELAPAEQAA